jgi:hypothetical protein
MTLMIGLHHFFISVSGIVPCRLKNFRRHLKKNCNSYFIVIMITVLIMIDIFWVVPKFQNSKLLCHLLLHKWGYGS